MQTIDSVLPFRPGLRGNRPRLPDPGPPPNPRAPVPGFQSVRAHRSIDGISSPAPRALQPTPPAPQPAPITFTAPPRPQAIAAPLPSLVQGPAAAQAAAIPLQPPALPSPARFELNPPKTRGIKVVSVLAIAILAGALILARQPFGQVVVMLYGIIAVQQRIASRFTFIMALGALGLALVSLVGLGGASSVPTAFATYAFLLLTIGALTLAFELRHETSQDNA